MLLDRNITNGSMAAVLGINSDQVKHHLRSHSLDSIDVANYNAVTQVVLSGPTDDLAKAEMTFDDNSIMYIPLSVSAPFHSRYMKSIANDYEKFLKNYTFDPLKIPVISNIAARPYNDNEIIFNLKEQLANSVQWLETIRYLHSKGPCKFKELGPGHVLEKLENNIAAGK